jgi:hypothetical protein
MTLLGKTVFKSKYEKIKYLELITNLWNPRELKIVVSGI